MDKNIWEFFYGVANKNLEQVAITDDNGSYTYQDIVNRAIKYHSVMEVNNIDFTHPVILTFDKDVDWISTMLAVNRAGGIFVNCPFKESQNRFDEIVESCDIKTIITNSCQKVNAQFTSSQQIIDISEPLCQKLQKECKSTKNLLATIFFTSGTTGTPKGVGISNDNILNLVLERNGVPLNEKTKLFLTGAINFDAVSFEIWGSLLNSGHLYISESLDITSNINFESYLKKNEINTLWLTAPLLKVLASISPKLFSEIKYLISGGDRVSPEAVKQIKEQNHNIKIFNGYGPTECTTFSTFYEIDNLDQTEFPIGKPLKNVHIRILDEDLRQVKKGIIGEIFISGKGLSPSGYLNADNNDKFIKLGEESFYRSGDFGYLNEQNEIVFSGRKDNQIKLNGFRVELSEIEGLLERCLGVIKAACIKKEDKILIYVQIDLLRGKTITDVKEEFKLLAPYHLHSLKIVQIEDIPLKLNGKIDYKCLEDLSKENSTSNPYEKIIHEDTIKDKVESVIYEVLGVEIDNELESFFDYGFDSLSAIYIANSLSREYSIELESTDLFENPSIKALEKIISSKCRKDKKVEVGVQPSEKFKESNEITSYQRPMYVDFELDSKSIRYNIPIYLSFKKKYDIDQLKKSVLDVANSFPNLRTKFFRNGEHICSLDSSPVTMDDIYQKEPKVFPFNLNQDFPIRFSILKGKDTNTIFFDFHHIAIDGYGIKQFLICLDRINNNLPKDHDQMPFAEQQMVKDQKYLEKYWTEKIKNYTKMNNIPNDKNERKEFSKSLTYKNRFETAEVSYIIDFAKENKITKNEVIMVSYVLMLSLITGSENVHFYSPSRYAETTALNSYDMRTTSVCIISKISKNETLKQFTKKFTKKYRQDLQHSYGDISSLIDEEMRSKKVDYGYKSSTDSLIAYHSSDEMTIDFLDIKQNILPKNPGHSMFDINFQLFDKVDYVDCFIEYESEVYSDELVEDLFHIYKMILSSLKLENSDVKLNTLFDMYLHQLM